MKILVINPNISLSVTELIRNEAQRAALPDTRITMATGAQVPVEDLRPGDRILTRDDGPQPLRWIGQRTTRASGLFAPVLIRAGTLNNARDLVVAPQ